MANQYNNKVVLSNGTTLIDLSTDTVTDASHIMSGKVGHLADGSVVTGTGASESQVVSIEDVPNTTGTTAVITGVAAPEGSVTITTNGTHDVTAYEEAVVNVSASLNVPTFSTSDGVTITCDKTYAECLALINSGEGRAFLSFAGGTTDSMAGGMNDLGTLRYYYVYSGALNARVDYKSNGTITITPIDTGQTLNVTSNGTYTQSGDNAWATVNVNVPSSTPTIQPLSVTSNGTYTAPSGVDGYSPVTVNVSGGGGGGSVDPDADVIFIDYDGTVLHSYSASEFANLTEMPENPSHAGLVAQGWNWSLTDAKAQLTAYPEAGLVIGQMYITDDGKTRIYVHMEDGRLHPYLGVGINGSVVIDWGDGTELDTLSGTAAGTVKVQDHEYQAKGDYVITLTVSGSASIAGTANCAYILRKSSNTSANVNTVYSNCVRAIRIGNNVTIGSHAFRQCNSLTDVTIPLGISSIASNAFANCYSLTSVTVPSGVTRINASAFNSCSSLALLSIPNSVTEMGTNVLNGSGINRVTLPNEMTAIGYGAFQECHRLIGVVIPVGVTSIGNNTFYGCYAARRISIPSGITIISDSVFRQCYSLADISIPNSAINIATNAFYACYSLASVTVPSDISFIGNNAFYNCYGVAEYHILRSTPPTLSGTDAFRNIQSDCKIYVPKGSLEAYQTATNWSNYASYMVEEE